MICWPPEARYFDVLFSSEQKRSSHNTKQHNTKPRSILMLKSCSEVKACYFMINMMMCIDSCCHWLSAKQHRKIKNLCLSEIWQQKIISSLSNFQWNLSITNNGRNNIQFHHHLRSSDFRFVFLLSNNFSFKSKHLMNSSSSTWSSHEVNRLSFSAISYISCA